MQVMWMVLPTMEDTWRCLQQVWMENSIIGSCGIRYESSHMTSPTPPLPKVRNGMRRSAMHHHPLLRSSIGFVTQDTQQDGMGFFSWYQDASFHKYKVRVCFEKDYRKLLAVARSATKWRANEMHADLVKLRMAVDNLNRAKERK